MMIGMSIGSMLGFAFGLGMMATVQSAENLQEEQLIEKVLAGDGNAFRGLVEAYQTRIYNIIYGMVHNRDDALELTQDSFIKAYKKLDTFKLGTKFYTWLCRIAVNTAIDFLRKNKNRQTLSFDEGIAVQDASGFSDSHFDSNPERAAIQAETRQKILDAVDELPEDQKQILILKEIDGLAYKEISEVLNIPQGTVMSRLYYARKKLQEILINLEK
jgi:RNA polymerase sigma-70 factor (ECF subfamily)